MYAVMETGGKQYRVQLGDIVQVEKLEGEVGANLKFDRVLFAAKPSDESSQIWLGKPYLGGASVQAEIVGQGRGDKILIIKMKRRKQYRRTQGHRQYYTQLLITDLDNGSGEKAELEADAKKTTLAKFQSHLKPKGEAFTVPLHLRKHPTPVAAKAEAKAATPKSEKPDKRASAKSAAKAKKES